MLGSAVLALVLAFGGVGGGTAVWLEACSQASRTGGGCAGISTSVTADGVTLGATVTSPGSPGSSATTPATSVFSSPRIPRPPRTPVLGPRQFSIILAGLCRDQSAPKNPPLPAARVQRAPTPPTSVSDLVAFQPLPPGIVIEPGSWSLPRVPTNIFSTASAQSQSGTLLGWPIEVRFTPQNFRWSYGDGTGVTRSESGSSWGSNQFGSTQTSHVFRAPGTYTVTLQVDYSVSYRFDQGGFVALAGLVTRAGPPATLQILRVDSVLVDEGCPLGGLVQGRCE
ncbi:MAG: PKD domain-containing protein [Pontimonas sp.]|nr:PKD domain-containing protein [Pontimonas sp.]